MKATQLDQMKEDYSYIMKTKTMTQNTVEKHREVSAEIITSTYWFTKTELKLGIRWSSFGNDN